MKKIFQLMSLLAMIVFANNFANAQLNIDDFDLQYENGVNDSLSMTVTSSPGDSIEFFMHRDTDGAFSNPVNVMSAVVRGPGTHNYGLRDTGLVIDVDYYYRLTLRNFPGQTVTSVILVRTTSIAVIGQNLVGTVLGPNLVLLTVDYMNHGSPATIQFLRRDNDSIVSIITGLNNPDMATCSAYVSQDPATNREYLAVISNQSNPTAYDTTISQNIITTPPSYALPPSADSINLVGITSSDVTVDLHWNSDSLASTQFIMISCDGFATPGTFVSAFGSPAGQHDSTITVPHACGPSSNCSVMLIVNNLFGGGSYDTLVRTFTTPAVAQTPENLVPRVIGIDLQNSSVHVAVFPFHATHNNSVIHFEMAESFPADTNLGISSSSWIVGPADTIRDKVFMGVPGNCYTVKTVLLDSNDTRQSWHADFQEVCFIATNFGDAPVSTWVGDDPVQEFDLPKDFKTGYPWPINVYDLNGKLILKGYFSDWPSLSKNLPANQFVYIRTDPDKRTGVIKTKKLVKVE